MDKLKFAKTSNNAIIPTKNVEDGAYDFYTTLDEETVIPSGENKLIPLGIATAFPSDYALLIGVERSSVGKLGIQVLGGLVDSGYRGEIFANIYNGSDKTLIISDDTDMVMIGGVSDVIYYPRTKAIVQGILLSIPEVETEEISYEELQDIPSIRGTGALGSSGK